MRVPLEQFRCFMMTVLRRDKKRQMTIIARVAKRMSHQWEFRWKLRGVHSRVVITPCPEGYTRQVESECDMKGGEWQMAEGLIGSRFQSDLFQRLKPTWNPLSFPLPRLQQPVSSKDDKIHGR